MTTMRHGSRRALAWISCFASLAGLAGVTGLTGLAACGDSSDAGAGPGDDGGQLDSSDSIDSGGSGDTGGSSDTGSSSDARDTGKSDSIVTGDVGEVGDGATAPPVISSFIATPSSLAPGESSTLSWTLSAASAGATLTLDGSPVTGTSTVVKPTATTKYTLSATNAGGTVSANATVTVTASTVPTKPITFTKDKPFTLESGTTNYVYVPAAYDSTHKTPITLWVWLHGCGGYSSGDVWTVSPGGSKQTWITLAPGGAEGGCWDMSKDPARVLTALADLKTHFNIKPKGVILGGYSSGGDLTYKIAFYNAGLFAGALVENTSPFRDTGSSQAASLAAASWKFNVVHLAHLQDTTYGIAGVRKETDAVIAAGFPLKRIEVDGGHWDDAGAIENGHAVPGTAADIATYLFPLMSAGWSAP